MLRLLHIFDIYLPFKMFIQLLMPDALERRKQQVFKLCILISSVILFAHMAAVIWMRIGLNEGGWLITAKQDPNDEHYNMTLMQIYIESFYWINTVLTTVGFGDFSGGNSMEYLYSCLLEFVGLLFFSLMTGLIMELV